MGAVSLLCPDAYLPTRLASSAGYRSPWMVICAAALTVCVTALCESPAGFRCTTATRLSPGRANSLAVAISVLIAGALADVRSLPCPGENDGRYRMATTRAAAQRM